MMSPMFWLILLIYLIIIMLMMIMFIYLFFNIPSSNICILKNNVSNWMW